MSTQLLLRSSGEADVGPRGSGTILVVEDEVALLNLLRSVLSEEYLTLDVVGAATSQKALEEAAHRRPILLLLDYCLYGSRLNGIELFDALHADPDAEPIPTIMIGADPPQRELEARGITRMSKPFDLDALVGRVAAELRVIT
jgi:DNA-binding response OmpR family regulator